MNTITLRQGQQVVWPRSPDGVAQVDDLTGRRTRVVLLYRRGHRVCRAVVHAARLARIQDCSPLLPGFEPPANYLGRGITGVARTKTFEVSPTPIKR